MSKVKEGISLTFDDVLIEPNISHVRSRKEVDISNQLLMPHNSSLTLFTPVISSCMDTVTEWDMAVAMAEIGGLGILHRNYPVDEIVSRKKTPLYKELVEQNPPIGVAVATDKRGQERVKELVDEDFYVFCVDTANGQSIYAAEMVQWIKGSFPHVLVMAGNVATAEGFEWLQDSGADMIRVGIGGGSFCTTRTTTGIGVPQLSSILECAEVANVPLIADGGIRRGSDAAKAFAAGADAIMLGGLLVGTKESPGYIHQDKDGRDIKFGRGMASFDAQPNPKPGYVPEGIEATVPYLGETEKVIEKIMGGVRSAMSYVGATDLKEFKNMSNFVRVTNAGLAESHPHILTY